MSTVAAEKLDSWESYRQYPTLAEVIRGDFKSVAEISSYLRRTGRWMGAAAFDSSVRVIRHLRPGLSDAEVIGILRDEIRD